MAGMGGTFFIIIIMSKTGTDNNQGVMWKLLSRPFFIKPVSMAVSVFNCYRPMIPNMINVRIKVGKVVYTM